MKFTDKFTEGEDWIKGESIGKGATCSCFKGRDVKTNFVMAVKQVRWKRI